VPVHRLPESNFLESLVPFLLKACFRGLDIDIDGRDHVLVTSNTSHSKTSLRGLEAPVGV
jgi:hypothetical protein